MLDFTEIKEAGLIRTENNFRLARIMERAKQGETLTIGFIGGSITMGSLASSPETCYAYRVFEWWKNRFPKASFQYRNAGIGATTSQFGVARVDQDLLRFRPDVVFVEFSVNDEDTPLFQETYEGLVRKIVSASWEPAVALIHNICYDTGQSAERIHSEIGSGYSLPAVSMKRSMYQAIQDGRIKEEEVTPDHLHPNDLGHEMVAGIVTHLLERVLEKLESKTADTTYQVPERPLTPNRFMNSCRLQNTNFRPELNGFTADLSVQKGITDIFKRGWQAFKAGTGITFNVSGSHIAVQYRKTVVHPAPVARAVVDGREEEAVILDANFTETWGDCLYLENIAFDLEKGVHTLSITVDQMPESGSLPFYLVSVITA